MSLNVDAFSRFVQSNPIVVDGAETFGLMNRPKFLDVAELNQDEVQSFTIKPPFVGRPDLIANELYGVSFLDWVIILSCNPKNTLNWPENGATLRLPTRQTVFAEGV